MQQKHAAAMSHAMRRAHSSMACLMRSGSPSISRKRRTARSEVSRRPARAIESGIAARSEIHGYQDVFCQGTIKKPGRADRKNGGGKKGNCRRYQGNLCRGEGSRLRHEGPEESDRAKKERPA